jgi:hypothetical protein
LTLRGKFEILEPTQVNPVLSCWRMVAWPPVLAPPVATGPAVGLEGSQTGYGLALGFFGQVC